MPGKIKSACVGALAAAALASTAAPAFALPVTSFHVSGTNAHVSGSLTWNNRSVAVQGTVHDRTWTDATVAHFEAYAGGRKVDEALCSANDSDTPCNPTLKGPRGGITKVVVWIIDEDGENQSTRHSYYRPHR
ncbi:hypothetical protein [Streptomyces europaeiscabiei]|uniref:hypothetical protein n=1 Tax=Streptomyces europaeiscabiei TaxID=146819 RepID=UPI0038F6284D